MASAVRNAMNMMYVNLAEAVAMASRNPAAFLGHGGQMGTIASGLRADFVVADDELGVVETWIGGEVRG